MPQGGYIRIQLPVSMSIQNPQMVSDKCQMIILDSYENLECTAGEGYFDIKTSLPKR